MREFSRFDIKLDTEKAIKIINKSLEECEAFRKDLIEKIGFEYGSKQDACSLSIDVQQIDNGVVNAVYVMTISLNEKELKSIVKILPANWKRLKTLNEVTVMRFISENLKDFPVPTIYGYDCEGDLIGNEFIFMSMCQGITLNKIYNDLTTEERKHYIEQIVKERSKLNELNFLTKNIEGDCYERKPLFGSYQNLEMKDGIVHTLIGPNCDSLKGPFSSFNDYIISLIDFRLEDMKIVKNGSLSYFIPKFQQFIQHLRESTIEFPYNLMTICHIDITPNNTLVNTENRTISGIIDWEWSSFSLIDEDISELLYTYATNDEERDFMIEAMNKYLLPNLNLNPDSFWKEYQERRKYFNAVSFAQCLTCYPGWFIGKEEEQEQYIEDMEQQVKTFFENLTF